ncbi:DUF106 domain-containing protein [Candidatus Bathyarchaeota archaeon]|nr:DUF106 domain-containing protein [Candidatus Bathyarchaeota archaeon]
MLQSIPISTIFILSLAAGVSLLTSLVNRLLSNPEKTKAMRKEVSEWNTELRKAQKAGDKKTLEKLMKKQQHIMQLQSKMMWQSMKVSLLFIVPLIIMWQILGGFYTTTGPDGQPALIHVAYFPGVGPLISLPLLGTLVSLFWWYLLCSFLFGTIFSHIFGLVEVSE